MASRYQLELALREVLRELHRSEYDVHALTERVLERIHFDKPFVKNDSDHERGGAEEALCEISYEVAGSKPPREGTEHLTNEDF